MQLPRFNRIGGVSNLHVEAIFEITQVMFIASFGVSNGSSEKPPGSGQRIILDPFAAVIVVASITIS